MNRPDFRPTYSVLIISLLNLFTFLALFLLRSLDDNRLTSWKWVFAQSDVAPILAILVLGLVLAYWLSKVSSLERHSIVLFVSSFVMGAIFWTEPEVIVDTARYFTQAKHLEMYGVGYFFDAWGKEITVWTDLPLVPFLYGLVFKILGEQRIYIQIFTTLLFSLTVMLTYGIGKALWDRNTGFVAGLLLLGIPYLLSQVPLMLVDVPTMFFLALSIFAFIRALEHGGAKWMILSTFAVFLAFFAKFSTWLWLSVLLIIFMVFLRKGPRSTFKHAGAIALLSILLVGAAILFKYDLISDQIRLLMSYQRPGLRRWGESFISTFLFQIHPFIALAALYSICVAIWKKDLKYAIIGWLPFLLFVMQIKRIRYTIPLFPMLTLMASYGLVQIRNREVMRFLVFCIIIPSIVLACFGYLPFLRSTSAVNLKDAGNFLNSLDVPSVEVFTLPQEKSNINPAISVPVLDLFTDKKIAFDMDTDPSRFREKVKKSALRFTWEYKNPEYYMMRREDLSVPTSLVVISSDPDQPLPGDIELREKDYSKSKVFKTSTGVFRYRTIVTVYHD